jgi:hypothetical protein
MSVDVVMKNYTINETSVFYRIVYFYPCNSPYATSAEKLRASHAVILVSYPHLLLESPSVGMYHNVMNIQPVVSIWEALLP